MVSAYDVVGVCGGLIVSSALVPQIFRVLKRRSAGDISYAYQAFFLVGLAMFLTYYGYYELWALFCTSLLAVSFMISLVCLKFHLEGFPSRHASSSSSTLAPTSCLLPGVVGDSGPGDLEVLPTKRSFSSRSKAAAGGGAKSTSRGAAASRDGGTAAAAGNSTEVQPLMSSW